MALLPSKRIWKEGSGDKTDKLSFPKAKQAVVKFSMTQNGWLAGSLLSGWMLSDRMIIRGSESPSHLPP